MTGSLYLVPVPISDADPRLELAPRLVQVLEAVRDYIVEDQRSAKRFLSGLIDQKAIDESGFALLNKKSPELELSGLLEPLRAGKDVALMSEAGSPCVADPGAVLVELAHREGIRVVALPGPSAILMALMASGLGGQNFSFNGYLPADEPGREKALRELERRSAETGSTQIFIETPYRNEAMLKSALKALDGGTTLSVAYALSSTEESVRTMSIASWRGGKAAYGKLPAVFILSAKTAPKGNHSQAKDNRGQPRGYPGQGKAARPYRRP